MRQVIRCWAIDYLAENILAPATTLHYPTRYELISELKYGCYTHVGINFVVATFHKVREMTACVRRYAPAAKIILGGYGTALPDEILRPHADAICREEGIGFLRRILDEPIDRPIRHPHAPIPSVSVLGFQVPFAVGHVTAGLGCPSGCDFCCTSHFFNRRYQPLAESGRSIYEALVSTRQRAEDDGIRVWNFVLIDEDFFLHPRRAREFLACVREGGQAFSLMGFGSTRGLSLFSAREIAEMGFTLIWNGFEARQAGYRKLEGKPVDELYGELKAVGCAQLASMIIGLPYQDPGVIRAELDQLLALEPAMIQCLLPMIVPGTPLHRRVLSEDRYLAKYRKSPDLRRVDGFSMCIAHPRFEGPKQIEALQREAYAEDFRRLGPSALRLARVWLTGYENLRHDPNPLLAERAEQLRGSVRLTLPIVSAAIAFGPSAGARDRARALRRDIIRLTGEPTLAERTMAAAAVPLYILNRVVLASGLLRQPGLLRTEHRTAASARSLHTRRVFALQSTVLIPIRARKRF